jgi:Protein of unknown function (DUF2798)
MPNKKDLQFAVWMSSITTLVVTFVLVSVNLGYTSDFLFLWIRSWLIAFIMVGFSILFLAPLIRKRLNK